MNSRIGANNSTPTLSGSEGHESLRARDSVFSSPSRSKSSSRSTSILLNGSDDRDDAIELEQKRVPLILLNGQPLDLALLDAGLGSLPAKRTRRSPQTYSSGDDREPSTSRASSYATAHRRPPSSSVIDPFRLLTISSSTHPSSNKRPLTPSLLVSLAPTIVKSRLLTFYSVSFPPSLQKKLAEEAFACLSLKASQVNCIDWVGTWRRLQNEREHRSSGLGVFGLLRSSRGSTSSSCSCSSSSSFRSGKGHTSGCESVSNAITVASDLLDVSAIQLELAVEVLARAADPKMRNLSAKSLGDMKDWDALARIIVIDAELLSAATPTPTSVSTPTPTPTRTSTRIRIARKVKSADTAKENDDPDSTSKTRGKGKCKVRAVTTPYNPSTFPVQVHVQTQDAYVQLTPFLPIFRAAHRNARQRYFKAVEWDGRSCRCRCASGFGLLGCFGFGPCFGSGFGSCSESCFGSTTDRGPHFGSGFGNDAFPAPGMGVGGGARCGEERRVYYKLSDEEEGDLAGQKGLEMEMRATLRRQGGVGGHVVR